MFERKYSYEEYFLFYGALKVRKGLYIPSYISNIKPFLQNISDFLIGENEGKPLFNGII
ncbi:hypothetical protein GCM10011389_25530 [Pontibacillus salipaludis]|uniref:Uncharacterized protein n=1 Tax=Pontibacillus salipaludis TaxID=1697394 RepID=A0ABQ1Q8J1_9BACI|nr:hypothetical protein GCM10011389_25530 [Pontibacillus salipaludis]